MKLPKCTPGEGGRPAREQFSYTNTPAGLKNAWTGWLACDPYWFKGHEHKPHDRGTQPCLTWITKGKLRCVRCGKGAKLKEMCYCHIYREDDGAPLLVIVQENVAEVMGGLGFRSHVLVGRLGDLASTFVKPTSSAQPFRTALEHRKNPIDDGLSLLGIWNIPALDEYFHVRSREGARVEVEEVPGGNWRLSVPAPTTTTEALAVDAHRKTDFGNTSGVNGALDNAMKRTKEVERNGKHEPEGQ